MRYAFLVETYATERLKVVSVWSEFRDEDLPVRPREGDPRGRSVHEQMVHQCVSEDLWFRNMLGIDVGAPPLPKQEDAVGVHEALCRGQRGTAGGAAGKRRSVVGRGYEVFRCAAVAGLGDDAADDAYLASSRTVDGDAADAGEEFAQQLRADGGYWRADAESCADDLCV